MRRLFVAVPVLAAAALAGAPAAAETGQWIVRARAILVAPNERTGPVQPTFPTGHSSVDNAVTPALAFPYMATKYFGAELILATTKHHVTGEGALAGVGRLAGTWVLPPTLT